MGHSPGITLLGSPLGGRKICITSKPPVVVLRKNGEVVARSPSGLQETTTTTPAENKVGVAFRAHIKVDSNGAPISAVAVPTVLAPGRAKDDVRTPTRGFLVKSSKSRKSSLDVWDSPVASLPASNLGLGSKPFALSRAERNSSNRLIPGDILPDRLKRIREQVSRRPQSEHLMSSSSPGSSPVDTASCQGMVEMLESQPGHGKKMSPVSPCPSSTTRSPPRLVRRQRHGARSRRDEQGTTGRRSMVIQPLKSRVEEVMYKLYGYGGLT